MPNDKLKFKHDGVAIVFILFGVSYSFKNLSIVACFWGSDFISKQFCMNAKKHDLVKEVTSKNEKFHCHLFYASWVIYARMPNFIF